MVDGGGVALGVDTFCVTSEIELYTHTHSHTRTTSFCVPNLFSALMCYLVLHVHRFIALLCIVTHCYGPFKHGKKKNHDPVCIMNDGT